MDFDYKPLAWTAEGVAPPDSVKNEGWLAGHRPPSAYFNYKWRADYLTQTELQQKLSNLYAIEAQDKASLEAAMTLKAPVDSPEFTGTPKAPTPVPTSNSTELATTEWVKTIVSGIDLSGVQKNTIFVSDANLNTLLGDQAYICTGTLSGTPISTAYCVLRGYDTSSTERVVQVCYVPHQINNAVRVRVFVRVVDNGDNGRVIGSWEELVDNYTLNKVKSLIDDNSFTNAVTLEAINKGMSTLFVENFANLNSVDLTKGSGETAITAIYDSDAHCFRKRSYTPQETVIYGAAQEVTGPNDNAWIYLDIPLRFADSSVKFEISRDNGTTWTELAHNTVTSIASQPAGTQIVYRVTLTNLVDFANLAWGLK